MQESPGVLPPEYLKNFTANKIYIGFIFYISWSKNHTFLLFALQPILNFTRCMTARPQRRSDKQAKLFRQSQ